MIVFVLLLYFFHSICVCDVLQVLVVTEAVDSQSYVVVSYVCFVFVFVFVSLFNLYLRSHCVVLQSLEE